MKRASYTISLCLLLSKIFFAQAGFYSTVAANNARTSAPAITVGATPNTCVDVGNLKTGIVQVRNLGGATPDNLIASQTCFLISQSPVTTWKNMWFRVIIPAGSTVRGLMFSSTPNGTQPTSSTNLRTAYINVYTGTSACTPVNVCSSKYNNTLTYIPCCSAPYIRDFETARVDVNAGTTYFVEVWTSPLSTDPNYNFDISVIPVGAHQTNETCGNASIYTTTSTNCNLGAYPSCNTYVPSCWGTIDNSVFFKFNRPSGSAFSVIINNITCEFGDASIQAAVFRANTTNCTTNLISGNMADCDDQTGNMTLTVTDALAAGTEYILWLDGNAGAACSWGITVLDVDLLYFKTNCRNGSAILEWASAKEKYNRHYIIEKSTNGVDFQEIGTVKGRINSYELEKYEFLDSEPYDGVSYYRLKQLDNDDNMELLGLVSYEPNCSKKEISLFPNPVKDYVSIEYDAYLNNSIGIEIIDPVGQIIKKTTHTSSSNNKYESVVIDVKEIPTGLYVVIVTGKYTSKKIKIVKE